MTNIIEEIFNSPIYDNDRQSAEMQALVRKEIALWKQIMPTIGLDKIDEITNTQSEIAHKVELEWFRRGIQLGASLVLELMD